MLPRVDSCVIVLTPITFSLFNVNGAKHDFNGRNLRMAAELWDPWFLISEESGQEKYSGIMPKILEYLQVSLNFTTTLVRPPDGAWGAVDENGNWGGMVGMVKRNEVDFALGEQISMRLKCAATVQKYKITSCIRSNIWTIPPFMDRFQNPVTGASIACGY